MVDGRAVRTPYELHTYFRLRSANSPAVDSQILIFSGFEGPLTFLTFQVSSGVQGHGTKTIGLDRVNKSGPVGARKYLVIFTLKGVKPHVTVLATSPTNEFPGSHGVNEEFHIFHCRIDPVELFREEKSQM